MTTNQLNNGLAWISAKATSGYNGCHWMLSAGSAYMIYKIVISKGLEQGVSIWLVTALAWVLAAVWYKSIEHTLKVILPFAIGFMLTPKDGKKEMTIEQRRTGRTSLLVSVGLLAATGSLSFFINPHISESVNTLEDSSAEIAQNESVRSSYDKDVEIYKDELRAAKAADRQLLEDAKATAALWVKAAQDVQGVTIGNLIRKGNVWAPKQLTARQRRKIKTEAARGERHVQAARDKATAPTLQGELTAYMKRSGSARDSVAMATVGIITVRQGDYNGKVKGMTRTLFYAVVFVLILFVFLCFLMVNARMSRGEEIVDDDSPGIFNVIQKSAVTLNKKLAKKLADKWDVKFVSAVPELALASEFVSKKVSAPAIKPAKSQPREDAENSLPRGFQPEKSAPEVKEVSEKVSAPPPPGLAVPPKVSAGFWIDEAVAYRKRVYGWWKTAEDTKRTPSTRDSNRKKAEAAFKWFRSQGCTVTFKSAGKVSIKFPKS